MSKKIHIKPGKTQSKGGFIVGILFCILGLVVVVPTFGPFGLVWTGVAAWITYVNYKNGYTKEGVDSHVIEVEDDGRNATMSSYGGYRSYSYEEEPQDDNGYRSEEDVETRLEKLQNLYSRSLITYEEYEAKKQEILRDL